MPQQGITTVPRMVAIREAANWRTLKSNIPTMRSHILSFLTCSAALLVACDAPSNTNVNASMPVVAADVPIQNLDGMSTAYFGAGCFWVEEAMFEALKGVPKVVAGYCGGTAPNPSYEEVCSGNTGHAETVQVYYDPKVIDYATLLKVFFGSQDPTTLDRQGPDTGTQYRSVVFYQNADEKRQAEDMIKELNASGKFSRPIVTQVAPFEKFWKAEDYHQGYEHKHPDQPYIANVSKPRYDDFTAKFKDLLK